MQLPFIPHLLSLSMIFQTHLSTGMPLQLQNQTMGSESNVPALYVIGDSLADPGNNNHIHTLITANSPPYGCDFDGRISTGRFSNGKLITDFLVSALGIKELLPPCMDQELRYDLCTGVSFASAGAGYDNITSEIMSAIPVWKQHVREKGNGILTDSLYAVILGSNDFLTTSLRRFVECIPNFHPPNLHQFSGRGSFQHCQGFEAGQLGCRGRGTTGTSVLCSKLTPFTCLDASKFVFWNSLHPTQDLSRVMVSQLLPLYSTLFL